jgi:glycerate 2-kinase
MSAVAGRDRLTRGNPLRQAALDIAEHVLAACNPARVLSQHVSVDGDVLRVEGRCYDMRGRQIFVVGAGKASLAVAAVLEDELGARITDGIVICKDGQAGSLARLRLRHAAHPVPDARSLAGAQECAEILARARAGDLVIACFTGGSSALFVDPPAPITLADKQALNRLLLASGAHIREINAVRKRVSRVKGGRLARALPAGCDLINLTVSDVIGDPLDFVTDPTVPDSSTLADARAALDRHGLWDALPPSIASYLRQGPEDRVREADLAHLHRQDVLLLKASAPCDRAAERAEVLGFKSMVLSTEFSGESRDLAHNLAAIAREVVATGRPLRAPCCLIAGGETVVTLAKDQFGRGGPNQEFALAAALELDGHSRILALAIDTDGTDGPTPAAGGLVDGGTAAMARAAGVDLRAALAAHDVTRTLEAVGDLVVTGATGTNVNDLKFLLVAGA